MTATATDAMTDCAASEYAVCPAKASANTWRFFRSSGTASLPLSNIHDPHAPMSELDAHRLTPTMISAASKHAVRTSTLRPTIGAVPYGWVNSNALA